ELTPTQMTLELADRSITHPKGVVEDVLVKVEKFHFLTDFAVVDFEADPRVPLILMRSFLRTGHALINICREEITVREILDFSNNSSGGNPTSTSEPILSDSSPSLTTFKGNDFILEEIEAYLKDESISPEIDHVDCDLEGDICLIEKLLNNDLFQLLLMDLKQGEVVKVKSSIEEPLELELKELPSHLEYAYLEGVDKLPVIIAKDLKVDEKEALLKVLKSHKRAIAWKIIDIKGIDPRFCTNKILMEEDYKLAVQSQRRVNPKIHEVIKKEVTKLLDAAMIYPISDSPWNALWTSQRCMMEIFHDMIEKTMEVFMDDFSVFRDSFSSCLSHLDTMLQRSEDTNLVLNWEKYHFIVKEGIVLGHKISKNRLVVDRAKVDVIAKLPHPTTDCIDAFETLKKKLTEAPILVVPDWNLPFELMCDASDFAIGAVLGQRKTKNFSPIHYASKTMTEAQIHYTTTKKELLAVVISSSFFIYLLLGFHMIFVVMEMMTLTCGIKSQGTTSNELDLLFSPMFDELLNGSSKVVSKSSAVSAADDPNQRPQPTTPLNNHTTPAHTSGSESRSPMLNKENYVPWSSRLLRYAKSRPNGKLIHNSILNGPLSDE
nr:DNA-directed DNA polymerase [Tanacetum cinerariifolium]